MKEDRKKEGKDRKACKQCTEEDPHMLRREEGNERKKKRRTDRGTEGRLGHIKIERFGGQERKEDAIIERFV